MEIFSTSLPGVLIIHPQVYEDQRGYFFESFNLNEFKNAGINMEVRQVNQSLSGKNVLRGLHFQKPPWAQAKLVRVIQGSVLDVAVDIRKNSPYYGKWVSAVLSEQNKKMLWIPEGFAHGFLTLDDNTVFLYKCSQFYCKDSEETILWNDPDIGIDWNIDKPVLSAKDVKAASFKNFISPF
jgi:dTDP-4-dehydrorhamnose 3,5-epimerase